jgi:hypothetical protein
MSENNKTQELTEYQKSLMEQHDLLMFSKQLYESDFISQEEYVTCWALTDLAIKYNELPKVIGKPLLQMISEKLRGYHSSYELVEEAVTKDHTVVKVVKK